MPEIYTSVRARPSLFTALQYVLPHHLLSRLVRYATRVRFTPWKNLLIRSFVSHYPVDMSEAEQPDPTAYTSFNAFFTRALKPGVRPVDAAASSIASPVDGTVSEAGWIDGDRLLQAKGHSYTLEALLDDRELAKRFRGGEFATLYLAPHNYHRIHMPVHGRLIGTRYVPGRLFSVNAATTQRVPGLFARNERVVCLFDTDAGRLAVILVGALFVGSMSTVWAKDITPTRHRKSRWLNPPPPPLELTKGAELGRFNMGSTVILLFESRKVRWQAALTAGAPVRMGTAIGTFE